MNDLTGKVALITGASRGIGRESALALARLGVRVCVNYRENRAAADEVVKAIEAAGGTAAAVQADVSDPGAATELMRQTEARLGPPGIIVNNAGVIIRKPLDQLGPDDWDHTMRTNLSSAFYVTQAALPGLRARKWGRIIFLSSVAAQTGGVIGPHYAASKAGMIGLMHSYANLLAKEGITANAIAPALIDTDMIRGNEAAKPGLIPIGRFGEASEVASIVVLLASNAYITGQTMNANGGWYMSS
jgi:3-oxoacyl-[acyl-carrier protein] reductase